MQCLQLTRGDAPSTAVTVTLSGTFSSTYAYVTIGGTKYTEATTLTVKRGTEIEANVGYYSTNEMSKATITLNGNSVGNPMETREVKTYSFAVTDNCKIVGTVSTGNKRYGTITITMPA